MPSLFFSSLAKSSSATQSRNDETRPGSPGSGTAAEAEPNPDSRTSRNKYIKFKTVRVTRLVKRASQSREDDDGGGASNELLKRLKRRRKERISGMSASAAEKAAEKAEREEQREEKNKGKSGVKKALRKRGSDRVKSEEFVASSDSEEDNEYGEDDEDEEEREGDANSENTSDDENREELNNGGKSILTPEVDSDRTVLWADAFKTTDEPKIIHSFDILNHENSNYESLFPDEVDDFVDLKYPCVSDFTERFYLAKPTDSYDSLAELLSIMQTVAEYYLDSENASKVYNDDMQDCIIRRIKRAARRKSLYALKMAVEEYNGIIESVFHGRNGDEDADEIELIRERVASSLADKSTIRIITHEVLTQVYRRVVSTHVAELRKYEAFSNNVYGELLPAFMSKLIKQLGLTSESVFIDLGSGVGNCVLQTAAEAGCESYGCEIMNKAADLADKQVIEARERFKLWGISLGDINIFKDDFTKNKKILAAMGKADVVLVNNYAFDAELNDNLVNMFLDLREGAKVVSLKTFAPVGHKISAHNSEATINMLSGVQELEFFSNSVSWTNSPGKYYVATIDREKLQQSAQ
ncbi:histone methylation protein DOT1-domain-containing protein [Lipomyces oligophaga]|uniref:histone methylation protein DOT1-domain-containing protein n=1 Tax=Lipomyces oligophaga TaxID=45792 RepID=UPI0034CE785D